MSEIRSFRDLVTWRKAMELTVSIYGLTRSFPREELYGLTSQLRRAAMSIPSNIAEGQGRRSRGEFLQFLGIARGSNFEVQTQLDLPRMLGYATETAVDESIERCAEVGRLLNGLIESLRIG